MSNLTVHTSIESPRGCGYRKPSKGGVGIYLVGPSEAVACDRLPFLLEACPCCGGGVKPSRSWAWIEPRALLGVNMGEHWKTPEDWKSKCSLAHCMACPMGLGAPEGRHGLIWVGEGFYPTPQDFMREAGRMGVSRKLPALPKGFELGKTVVYLAHRKVVPAVMDAEGKEEVEKAKKGIFTAFRPTGVDLVIEDENTIPERAKKIVEKLDNPRVRLVKVIKAGEQTELGL
jgi:hypothetical protein